MKLKCGNLDKAVTKVEVILVIVVLAVFAALLVPVIKMGRDKVRRKVCMNHLIQFTVADRQWLIDNNGHYSPSLSTNVGGTREYIATGEVFRHFQAMSNELRSPNNLVCPSDVRKPATDFSTVSDTNLSYFVGVDADETRPFMFRAGDRNLTNGLLLPNRIMELTSNSVVGWTAEMHRRGGNILVDGVYWLSDVDLRGALTNTGVATNRLAMP